MKRQLSKLISHYPKVDKFFRNTLLLLKFSIIKSLRINFHYLPFKQAIRFPILVHRHMSVSGRGEVSLLGPICFGRIQLGKAYTRFVNGKSRHGRIRISGKILIEGRFSLDVGASLIIWPEGFLRVEDNVIFGHDSLLVCYHKISIGKHTGIAWECQIFDSSFHYVQSDHDRFIGPRSAEIRIGAHNWIGNRVTINRGTITPDYTIVASNSLLSKDYTSLIDQRSIIAGMPAKLVKTGLTWIFDATEEALINNVMKKEGGTNSGVIWPHLINDPSK